MADVYVLTVGEYSDYRILGVFSSLDMAEKFKTNNPNYEDATPEVWTIDGQSEYRQRPYWDAIIYIKDGRIDKNDYSELGFTYGELALPEATTRSIEHVFVDVYDFVRASSYVSYDHAEALAIETRQKILRERMADPIYKYSYALQAAINLRNKLCNHPDDKVKTEGGETWCEICGHIISSLGDEE